MRAATRFATVLSMSAVLAGQCAPALAAQAYEGFWASTKKDCRDRRNSHPIPPILVQRRSHKRRFLIHAAVNLEVRDALPSRQS